MASIAILDESLPIQLRERPDELDPVSVVWTGTDRNLLSDAARNLRPTVLVLDMELLGDEPLRESHRISQNAGAELVLLLHRFAPREVVREAARSGVRPVRAPLRLTALRTQLTSVIVRELLGEDTKKAPVPVRESAPAPTRPPVPELGIAEPRAPRFSRAQLARLAEIQSSVECECPNHLSDLLVQLNAFEAYSKSCQNRDDADAKIHALLATQTGHARAIVEDALAMLLVHERIVL